jgi:PAS domain-containing protein
MRVNEPITNHEVGIPDDKPLVSRTDPGGRITFVNQSLIGVSGCTREELLGAPHNLISAMFFRPKRQSSRASFARLTLPTAKSENAV